LLAELRHDFLVTVFELGPGNDFVVDHSRDLVNRNNVDGVGNQRKKHQAKDEAEE
jgi:hypothetical protein